MKLGLLKKLIEVLDFLTVQEVDELFAFFNRVKARVDDPLAAIDAGVDDFPEAEWTNKTN